MNNLHIYDNLLLFTFEIENKSKLPYDIDYIRYYIIDKKTAKLTASQEVDQQALFSENYSPRIEGNGRMKYVIAFDKFTIPDEKFSVSRSTRRTEAVTFFLTWRTATS